MATKKYPYGRAFAEGITEKDVDPEELRLGITIEYEHTDDPEISRQISLDHLSEFPDYYTRLIEMEAEAKKYWAKRRMR